MNKILQAHSGRFCVWRDAGFCLMLSSETVNAECANVASGNGVLLITLPIREQTLPACLTLERITPTHGERKGDAGHPPLCVHT